jgi:hypothetical protein
MFYPKLSPVVK